MKSMDAVSEVRWGLRFGWARPLCRVLVACSLFLTLSSCYVPDNFVAELRLSRYGDYELTFRGDLVYLPILYDYAAGRVPPDQDLARQQNIRKDLIRDKAFTKVIPLGHGRFRVTYEGPVKYPGVRGARLGKDELVSIIRRDSRILALRSLPDNEIIVAASHLRPVDAKIMAEEGVAMKGQFRVTTNANVIQNNASEVRPYGRYKVYIWNIDGPSSPMPHLIAIRDFDPTRPLPQ
jgi:hypothetical protein